MALAMALLSGLVVAQQDPVIQPGDQISITVYGEPDLSIPGARVPANGIIAYPLLGPVQVANHTLRSLEQHITSLLMDGFLTRPRVTVSIAEYRPIFVNGAVKTPGAHKFAEGLTVEKAISLAGGLEKDADPAGIALIRENTAGGKPTPAEMNARVLPGDVINIPSSAVIAAEKAKAYIYLHGEVRTPGGYEFRQGLTVEKAIALAGGFTARASKGKIEVTRDGSDGESKKIRGAPLTEPVEPGDVINVGASFF
jgi:polysaccharide export outer membrane protein